MRSDQAPACRARYFYFAGDGFGFGYGLAVRTDARLAKPPRARSGNTNGTPAAAPISARSRARRDLYPDRADPERARPHQGRVQEDDL